MKKLWEAAKDEKERIEVLLATSISALGELSNIIDESMGELARLAEEYARLSFSDFFSAIGEGNLAFGTTVSGNGGERSWFGAVDEGAI